MLLVIHGLSSQTFSGHVLSSGPCQISTSLYAWPNQLSYHRLLAVVQLSDISRPVTQCALPAVNIMRQSEQF